MISDKLAKQAGYLSSLRNSFDFREYVLAPLKRERDSWELKLHSTQSSERELFTAQGALAVLDRLDALLNEPESRYRAQLAKKEKTNVGSTAGRN